MSTPSTLPAWAAEITALYESHAASQFVLHGNVHDSLLLPGIGEPRLGKLDEYVLEALIPQFEVVLTYDLGGGLRVVRGQQTFAAWPSAPTQGSAMPRAPREANAAADTAPLMPPPTTRTSKVPSFSRAMLLSRSPMLRT